MEQGLADRGYVCLQVNFRGSTGFGKKFVNAGNKEWGRKMQDDLTDAALLRECSPIFFTDKIRIPILIAQGVNDPRTPKAESDTMVEALRQRGIECEYVLFPDEGHGFAKLEDRLKFFQIAEAFLARHLGGRYQK